MADDLVGDVIGGSGGNRSLVEFTRTAEFQAILTGYSYLIDTNEVPVGAIVEYAGTAAPSGWLLCNGASYERIKYPTLAALIGGSGTTFTVPTKASTSIIKAT
jgi:hypothetical protein